MQHFKESTHAGTSWFHFTTSEVLLEYNPAHSLQVISDQSKYWQVIVDPKWPDKEHLCLTSLCGYHLKKCAEEKELREISSTVDGIGNSSKIFIVFKLSNSMSRHEIIHLQPPNSYKMIPFPLSIWMTVQCRRNKTVCLIGYMILFTHIQK